VLLAIFLAGFAVFFVGLPAALGIAALVFVGAIGVGIMAIGIFIFT